MRPKERRESEQKDLFKARLDQIVDLDHALVKMARVPKPLIGNLDLGGARLQGFDTLGVRTLRFRFQDYLSMCVSASQIRAICASLNSANVGKLMPRIAQLLATG